ncbi:hypothetical protein [Paenibacillus tyrfis]|uniref:hypothetical protein n=1 Tax=Paenibacillus tyrfis TaxID=1501230 RepID=UPI00117E2A60|nr:hypothetical protein [Paenibacillus tyrfis]
MLVRILEQLANRRRDTDTSARTCGIRCRREMKTRHSFPEQPLHRRDAPDEGGGAGPDSANRDYSKQSAADMCRPWIPGQPV